jgi:hypothetical protein
MFMAPPVCLFLLFGALFCQISTSAEAAIKAFSTEHLIVRFKAERIAGVATVNEELEPTPATPKPDNHPPRAPGVLQDRNPSGFHAPFPLTELGLPEGAELIESGYAQWRREHSKKAQRADSSGRDSDWDAHFLVRLPRGLNVESALKMLRENPLVDYAEPDYIATAAGSTTVFPTDPDFHLQWHHNNPGRPIPADIQSTHAWALTRGSTNVVVAVLDTGCNGTLSEFSGRMLAGYDFVNRDADPSDDNGHGTEVAGVLAANANNGLLVAGVDWRCKILPVKVLASDRSGLFSTLADGIDWAVERGAHIISLSAGGTQDNMTLSNAVARAINRGVVFVAAVHNDGASIRFPARIPGVIAVGASTELDRRASFSNFGPELSLLAPGTNIYTVGRFGLRQVTWGTSMAAPQVAGAAALLLSIRPDLTPSQVRELLCAGADDQVGAAGQDTPGFDHHHGFGRLNIHASLLLARAQLEILRGTNSVQLSWIAPSNSSIKRPFEIQFSNRPEGPWQTLPDSSQIIFSEGRANWVDDGSETGSPPAFNTPRFYRLKIRK